MRASLVCLFSCIGLAFTAPVEACHHHGQGRARGGLFHRRAAFAAGGCGATAAASYHYAAYESYSGVGVGGCAPAPSVQYMPAPAPSNQAPPWAGPPSSSPPTPAKGAPLAVPNDQAPPPSS